MPLHQLGWKAFQDLCVSIAEECLKRPVQKFLPVIDGGRDGAFVGRWNDRGPARGESTIQCKFTSKAGDNLTLSKISGELEKAKVLAARGLASDYIILTNHTVTGSSELKIREKFEAKGVGRCRVFGYDWIVSQVQNSPRLRMLAPRLYGLGRLGDLLDARAYAQAQLILSAMGEDLERLVVTDAYRRSVRAIGEHKFVLLLGSPAAGKSTIGASLAVGAADHWQAAPIRASSPQDIQKHLDPDTTQFFWIDDAWGNTQYQRHISEEWNKIFPLIQGAMKRGTRFLLTSRDYIWNAAQRDLKVQALPVLRQSQVIINVHEFTSQERAQILYNHIKFGDQSRDFRSETKQHLAAVAQSSSFLPETARRFGSKFFTAELWTTKDTILGFFERPRQFLEETITNLAAECQGAVAVVFMNRGKVRSPLLSSDVAPAAAAFGVTSAAIKEQLSALNGSLLLLAKDEKGAYWTYKHPTVGDAFARYLANDAERVEIYLRGAHPEALVREVVCAGTSVYGAEVIVPDRLHGLLADRIASLGRTQLTSFLSYRSNRAFSRIMLQRRPDLLSEVGHYVTPIKDDLDANLFAALHEQGLLPEGRRLELVEALRKSATNEADASFLEDELLAAILTEEERDEILAAVDREVMDRVEVHVDRIHRAWANDYPPGEVFDDFRRALRLFSGPRGKWSSRYEDAINIAEIKIGAAVQRMYEEYEDSPSSPDPVEPSTAATALLGSIFRDVDQ